MESLGYNKFELAVVQFITTIDILSIANEIALMWMTQDLAEDPQKLFI